MPSTATATNSKGVAPPDPLDPLQRPPLEQYCDLVLKGGVVDGVIYPGALIELARSYRFQSLAGTSVGAIAVALAAACEYARRFGSDSGFNEVLRTLPQELGEPPVCGPHPTVLRSLFQTEPGLQRLFDVAVKVASGRRKKFWSSLVGSLWQKYTWSLLGGFLAGFALSLLLTVVSHGVEPGALFQCKWPVLLAWAYGLGTGVLVALVGMAVAIYCDLHRLSRQPGFGFCSGRSTDGGKTEGLTDWLHRGIQGAAGLSLGRPLTFQDLWLAPNGPIDADGRRSPKSIDLRMMTTCVSHGRPYELPLQDQSVRLFFRPCELSRYFPRSIITHLTTIGKPYDLADMEFHLGRTVRDETQTPPVWTKLEDMANSPNPEPDPCPPPPGTAGPIDPCEDTRLYELPRGDLPVLVAVRLSMNFPILFQAVPLWAIDHERGRVAGAPHLAPLFKRAWFADGGISSNFPLHIFDSALPSWPTFGLYIAEKSRRQKTPAPAPASDSAQDLYDVTRFHTTGRNERWHEIDDPTPGVSCTSRATGAPGNMKAFLQYLAALFASAKDWSDNANLRMPGVRDRVAIVFKNDERNGGLNLNLQAEKISELAYVNGVKAGRRLADKFLPGGPRNNENLDGSAAWLDHRWVRFNSHLAALKKHIEGFGSALTPGRGVSPLDVQIMQATVKPPLYQEKLFEPVLTAAQAGALQDAVKALQRLEQSLTSSTLRQPYVAKPQFELKARAPL